MLIPTTLLTALQHLEETIPYSDLKAAAESIGLRYRSESGSKRLVTAAEAAAYALAWMPATFCAVLQALTYMMDCLEQPFDVSQLTVLDAGAGTGAVAWAAAHMGFGSVTCFEREPAMMDIGRKLMDKNSFIRVQWINGDLSCDNLPAPADLVVASYVCNELPQSKKSIIISKLWASTRRLLLLVEPGTHEGSSCIMQAREMLLAQGATVIAPCPHNMACPLYFDVYSLEYGIDHGCHFSCRVPRSRVHRLLKSGDAPYEDEKYMFLALLHQGAEMGFKPEPGSRVLRHPIIGKGRVLLTLCKPEGTKQEVSISRDHVSYKRARKVKWGDVFETEYDSRDGV